MTVHIADWLRKFQSHVNTIAGNAHLVFTASVWTTSPYDHNVDKISVIRANNFPYLDMELYWDRWNNLKTRVYRKPNQALKYVSRDSTHTSQCLRAIPHGVFQRLAKLTSVNKKLRDTPVNRIYPDHVRALNNAQLLKGVAIPTMGELWSSLGQSKIGRKNTRINVTHIFV